MIAVLLLVCLLVVQPAYQVSDSGSLDKLVSSGWEEHKIPKNRVGDLLNSIIYPGITLTNSAVVNQGSMRVSLGPTHKMTRFTDEHTLEAVHDDLKTKYEYTLDSGEKGSVTVKAMNRTYSMVFQSSTTESGKCRTLLLNTRLAMEGPVEIKAKGGNSNEAVKIVEKIRHLVVLQSRSFAYYEIILAMNESLKKRKPKLCQKKSTRNSTHPQVPKHSTTEPTTDKKSKIHKSTTDKSTF